MKLKPSDEALCRASHHLINSSAHRACRQVRRSPVAEPLPCLDRHLPRRASRRAIEIFERLKVLKDYSTPPNCTSPFVPVWITQMVRRHHDR